MNRLPVLFVGIFFTFSFAWAGLVIAPYFQIGRLQPVEDKDAGTVFPPPVSGQAEYGRRVYAASGCIYCHSQQVRGFDMLEAHNRGWGTRRTVARDYIGDKPVFLGTMRTGPDLSNIGRRQPSTDWHHKHLYAPQLMTPGSIMAPFRYLYKMQPIAGQRSPHALLPDSNFKVEIPDGYELVPTEEAEALVAYILSLNRGYPLPEAPEQ